MKTCPKCGDTSYHKPHIIHCPKCLVGRLEYITAPQAHKFGAKRSMDNDGRAYPSVLERDVAMNLQLLEQGKEIKDLDYQPGVQMLPGIRFKPDFSYISKGEKFRTYVDAKGITTNRFRLICKLWALFGCQPDRRSPLHTIQRVHGHLKTTKVITPITKTELRKELGL